MMLNEFRIDLSKGERKGQNGEEMKNEIKAME